MSTHPRAPTTGPVVFAYDGSDLARLAIEEAGRQLAAGRDGLVLTVWQPFDLGFIPADGLQFNTEQITEVRDAAERTAADGARQAGGAGFRAQSLAVEGSPSWKIIVEVSEARDASLIVLGSHGHTGLADALLGSVARAVAAHSRRSVLIAHRRA
jgi:nucleotide-binding universal stress UspA family protein